MATFLISLCFSIIGTRSRSQLLLEENFFHCSGLLIFRLILTSLHTNAKYEHIFDRFMFWRSVIDVKDAVFFFFFFFFFFNV